jgi:hypothetical protein
LKPHRACSIATTKQLLEPLRQIRKHLADTRGRAATDSLGELKKTESGESRGERGRCLDLEAEVLAEEGVGLRREACRAPRGIHGLVWGCGGGGEAGEVEAESRGRGGEEALRLGVDGKA